MHSSRANRDAAGGLIYKTHAQGREPAVAPALTGAPGEVAVARWEIDALADGIGQALGIKAGEVRRALSSEIDLLRRQLAQLRAEFDADRGLKALQAEIAAARADVPKLPDVEARFAAKQAETRKELARLRRELEKAQSKIGDLRVEASQTKFFLREMEKEKRVDTRTLDVLQRCAEQWMADREPEPKQPEPAPFRLLPQLEYVDNTGSPAQIEERADGAAQN